VAAPAPPALVPLQLHAQPRARLGQRPHEVGRPAVDELRSRLDGRRPPRQALRVDAAADARPRLQHDDAKARPDQSARGLQARDTRADDDHVSVAGSSSVHAAHNARRAAH